MWNRVAGYERRHGVSSTSSLLDVQRRTASQVEPVIAGLRPLLGQRGLLIGVVGHPVLLEMFDHPRTHAILAAVALDAVGAPIVMTGNQRARAFVNRVQHARLETLLREPDLTIAVAGDDLVVAVRASATPTGLMHAAALNVRHDLVLAC